MVVYDHEFSWVHAYAACGWYTADNTQNVNVSGQKAVGELSREEGTDIIRQIVL